MINLNELTSHHPAFPNIVASYLPHYFAGSPQATNHSGNDFRHARKCQTIREITFAKRGNAKPFGKRLSPSDRSIKCFDNGFEQERKSPTLLRDLYNVGTNSTILLSSFLFFYKNHTWKMERNYLSLQLIMQY